MKLQEFANQLHARLNYGSPTHLALPREEVENLIAAITKARQNDILMIDALGDMTDRCYRAEEALGLPGDEKPCRLCGQPLGKVARVHLDGEEPEWYHMTCARVPEDAKDVR